MRLSTVLALVLAAVFAAANPFALLMKRDSSSSIASTLNPGHDPGLPEQETDTIIANAMNSCFPINANGNFDFNAPCNQFEAIVSQCSYGPRSLSFLSPSQDNFPRFTVPEWHQQSPETERTCICQSQITDVAPGCAACFKAHEHPWMDRLYEQLYHPTMFQQYCDVDYTVTQSFAEFSDEAFEQREPSEDESSTWSSSYTGEHLSTSTDVSLYYTLSVTRSDAYDIAVPTSTSGGDAMYTTTRISGGQIVLTAQAEKEAGEQDPGEAGTSSISISASSTSSFSDRFTTSSASSVSRTRSLNLVTPSASQSPYDDERDSDQASEGCYPRNATGYLDYNAPCNQVTAIRLQCEYGPRALKILTISFDSGEYPSIGPSAQKQSPETERTCICQSQIADVTIGCLRCNVAHHLLHQSQNSDEFMHTAMQQYCDINYTTTQGFSEFLSQASSDFFHDDDGALQSYTREAISTSTEVYFYYTMSVTRSDAYDVNMPTSTIWGDNVIYTSTRTSDGQIVPTARSVKDPDSPTTGSGAAAMHAGAAGMVAMAALAALGL